MDRTAPDKLTDKPSTWSIAGLQRSCSVGDSYDNALAETINDLFKAEVIHKEGLWKEPDAVEGTTLNRVDWFNNQ